jgi:hypothetical protein
MSILYCYIVVWSGDVFKRGVCTPLRRPDRKKKKEAADLFHPQPFILFQIAFYSKVVAIYL